MEKTLVLGKIESRRRTEQQRMSWMYGNTNSMDMSFERTESYVHLVRVLSVLRVTLSCRRAWHAAVHRVAESDTT